MRKILILILLLARCATSAAGAMPSRPDVDPSLGCERNPAVAGKCFKVHARVRASNGVPNVRMWPVGTKRHYGVIPPEREILPGNLARHVQFGHAVYGDFTVCPFTVDQPDHMLMVCIQEASNMVIESFGAPGEAPTISYDRSREAVP